MTGLMESMVDLVGGWYSASKDNIKELVMMVFLPFSGDRSLVRRWGSLLGDLFGFRMGAVNGCFCSVWWVGLLIGRFPKNQGPSKGLGFEGPNPCLAQGQTLPVWRVL